MSTDPTKYPRHLEPTQAVYYNPYEYTNPYGDIPPPPPPPKQSHNGLIVVLASLVCLLIVMFAGGLFVAIRSTAQQPATTKITTMPQVASTATLPILTPTQQALTSTINPNYSASDILRDFNAAGIHSKFVEYNKTIWSWTEDMYYVSVHATSSVDFTDDSACTGYSSPQDIGVWVYDSQGSAWQAYNDVLNDENKNGSIPMMGTPNEVLRGRCLLLGTDTQSIYGQVVMQDCI